MAAFQSPVRRLSVDLSQNEKKTPAKVVNQLKNLLKTRAQTANSANTKKQAEVQRDPNISYQVNHKKVTKKSVKKPSRQRKKNYDNIDKDKRHVNDDRTKKKNNTIDKNNSKSRINNNVEFSKATEKNNISNKNNNESTSGDHNKSGTLNNTNSNSKTRRLKKNCNEASKPSKEPESPKTKRKNQNKWNKNVEQPVEGTSTKSQAINSSKQRKKKTCKNNKNKCNSKADRQAKLIKAVEIMGRLYSGCFERKAIVRDLAMCDIELSSSEHSSSACSSDDNSSTSDTETNSSDESYSCSSSPAIESYKRYNLRKRH